mmetsp:Transcript_19363/g.65616  ORF Transcript_19363/g.65616 Transcript_19363/m.65616 type:complete len:218 (+) Transcript_19363:106-759(+)
MAEATRFSILKTHCSRCRRLPSPSCPATALATTTLSTSPGAALSAPYTAQSATSGAAPPWKPPPPASPRRPRASSQARSSAASSALSSSMPCLASTLRRAMIMPNGPMTRMDAASSALKWGTEETYPKAAQASVTLLARLGKSSTESLSSTHPTHARASGEKNEGGADAPTAERTASTMAPEPYVGAPFTSATGTLRYESDTSASSFLLSGFTSTAS